MQIARRQVPVLSFTAIHGELYRVAVGPMEGLVAMQNHLNDVLSRWNISQVADRVTKSGIVDDHRLSGPHPFNIHPKDHLGTLGIIDLHARLFGRVGGQQQEQATVDRPVTPSFREGNREARSGVAFRRTWQDEKKANEANKDEVNARARESGHGVSLEQRRIQQDCNRTMVRSHTASLLASPGWPNWAATWRAAATPPAPLLISLGDFPGGSPRRQRAGLSLPKFPATVIGGSAVNCGVRQISSSKASTVTSNLRK